MYIDQLHVTVHLARSEFACLSSERISSLQKSCEPGSILRSQADMAPAAKKQKLSNGGVAATTVAEEVHAEETAPEEKPAAEAKAEPQRLSLFVRSLPANTTTESLTELFSESYPIKHATAVIDPATKQCRGFGFVTFADAEDAQRAKKEFNGRVVQDRKLRVEVAEPRHRQEGSEATPKVKPERETQAPPKLIVRNLPWSIKGSHQLEKLFQSYGKVKQAYVPRKGAGLMATGTRLLERKAMETRTQSSALLCLMQAIPK